MITKINRRAGEAAPARAKAPSPLRSAGALHKAMADSSPMECGGNDAALALAGRAPGSVPQGAPSAGRAEEGELPDGWRWSPVSEITRTFTGGTPSREHPEYFGGSIKWAKSGDLNDGVLRDTEETITDEGLAKSNAKKCPPGTLLVALYGATTGKVALLDIEAAINQAICALVPTTAADSEFLMYALTHRRAALLRERYGGAQPNISQTVLRAFELPLPPLPEQRAIVGVLRTVQGAKEACERVLAATRQLKQSLLHHLFTYGPVPFTQAAHVPLKETKVGPMPEHWSVVSIGDIETFMQYGTSSRCESGGSGLPVLRIPNVVGGGIDTADLKYLAASPTEIERHLLQRGDLLFVRTNGVRENVGRCAVYLGSPARSLFASYLIRARLAPDRALPEFVQLFTETSTGRASFTGRASGAADGKFNINTQTIRSTILPLPPLPEQREIAAQLAAVDVKLAAEESRRRALTALFQSLLHHLMTGQVRVPLDCGGKLSATPLSPST